MIEEHVQSSRIGQIFKVYSIAPNTSLSILLTVNICNLMKSPLGSINDRLISSKWSFGNGKILNGYISPWSMKKEWIKISIEYSNIYPNLLNSARARSFIRNSHGHENCVWITLICSNEANHRGYRLTVSFR